MSSLFKSRYIRHNSISPPPCPKCKSRRIDCSEEFNNIYPQGRFIIHCMDCFYTVGSLDLDICLKVWCEGK